MAAGDFVASAVIVVAAVHDMNIVPAHKNVVAAAVHDDTAAVAAEAVRAYTTAKTTISNLIGYWQQQQRMMKKMLKLNNCSSPRPAAEP